jgi:hypothetical protein
MQNETTVTGRIGRMPIDLLSGIYRWNNGSFTFVAHDEFRRKSNPAIKVF